MLSLLFCLYMPLIPDHFHANIILNALRTPWLLLPKATWYPCNENTQLYPIVVFMLRYLAYYLLPTFGTCLVLQASYIPLPLNKTCHLLLSSSLYNPLLNFILLQTFGLFVFASVEWSSLDFVFLQVALLTFLTSLTHSFWMLYHVK